MKPFALSSALLLFGTAVCAQSVVLTPTITDRDGTPWARGSWSALLVSPAGAPTVNGAPVPTYSGGSMDAAGVASLALARTDTLDQPAGAQWVLTFCPNASVTGCSRVNVPITGSTTSATLGSAITSQLVSVRFRAGANAFGYADLEALASAKGDTYFRTSTGSLRFWDGASWTGANGGGPATLPSSLTGVQTDASGNPTQQTLANIAAITGNANVGVDTTNAANVSTGVLAPAQLPSIPAAKITGLAPSATTDSTNASNITSGTLPAGQLPAVPVSKLPVVSTTQAGILPALPGGTTTFLRADGSYATPATGTTLPASLTGVQTNASGVASQQTLANLQAISGNQNVGVDTTNASNIVTGTLPTAQLPTVPAAKVSGLASSATTDTTNASNIVSGTLPVAQTAALTGDVTKASGSAATTVTQINGAAPAGTYGTKVVGGQLVGQTKTDIQTLIGYTPAPAPTTSGNLLSPIADYSTFPGSGTVLPDSSGNGYNGTISGSNYTWGINYLYLGKGDNVSLPAALNNAKTYGFVACPPPLTIVPQGGQVDNAAYETLLTSSLGNGGPGIMFNPPTPGALGTFTIWPNPTQVAANYTFTGCHRYIAVIGSGGDGDHEYIDGVEVAYSNRTTTSLQTSGNLFLGNFGGSPWGPNSGFYGNLYRAIFYASRLTGTDISNLDSLLNGFIASTGATLLPTVQHAAPIVAATGDSITIGAGGSGTTWPGSLSLTGAWANATVQNWGLAGAKEYSFAPSNEARINPYCRATLAPTLGIVAGGTNDMGNFNSASAFATGLLASVQRDIQGMKAGGCKVAVATLISKTGSYGYTTVTPADQQKNAYNTLLRQRYKAMGADLLIDFGAIPQLGADGATANATWSGDGTHPTPAGYTVMGTTASNAINAWANNIYGAPVLFASTVNSTASLSGGAGYTSAPTVVFAGGSCDTMPVASATISSGAVNSITFTQAGNCETTPSITLTGGGYTTQATATAALTGVSAYTMTASNVASRIVCSVNCTVTLPSGIGQTDASYRINNGSGSGITVMLKTASSTQPINGTDYSSSGLSLANGSTVTLRDVANPPNTSGMHWEM